MLVFGVINVSVFTNTSFYLWICTQLSFIQEFTPEILKGLGHGGTPNPPLWTISVEMLLYMFIPILYKHIASFRRRTQTLFLLFIALLSYCQNQVGFITECLSSMSSNGYWLILIHPFCQFFSFAWYFVIGILIYLYKGFFIPYISGKGLIFLIVYVIACVFAFVCNVPVGSYSPYGYSLLLYFFLILSVFSLAYTKPTLTRKLFGKTDISYGLYIYHMLVLKIFNELGLTSIGWMSLAIVSCFIVAYISWEMIEKRALKLKTKSLYKGA
jgi:peptidoglycan/LPS O-acetylase OafA/YrhL